LVEHTTENRGVAGSIPALAIALSLQMSRFQSRLEAIASLRCGNEVAMTASSLPQFRAFQAASECAAVFAKLLDLAI
jgi:hypothetical protein